MDSLTHIPIRRFSSALAVVAIFGTLVLGQARPASAANTCHVRNATTSVKYTDFQSAIGDASDGDTLRLIGTCTGNFKIEYRSLTIRGKSTAKFPNPTLDGGSSGVVLAVTSPKVTIFDLTITNGNLQGGCGGGITHGAGTLVLRGSTSVTGNTATNSGGGICNSSVLKLFDTTTITSNSVTGQAFGGGIENLGGTVKLFGSSTISGNSVAMTDPSGGGIHDFNGTPGAISASNTWIGSVSGNTPDDCEPDVTLNGTLCT